MAKIGIMSMQRIINYGSFLQSYGLKKIMEDLGHEVQFVDYHVGVPLIGHEGRVKKNILRKLSKGIEYLHYKAPLLHRIKSILHKKNFAGKYHGILNISGQMNYNAQVDMLIIGSDEVFNCIQQNQSAGYSLELFGKDSNAHRLISYAASFGNTSIEELVRFGKEGEIRCLLKKFDTISVRDKNSGNIVKELTGKEPLYHMDPVLVYDFMNRCKKIKNIKSDERYLLLYAYSGRISDIEADTISLYAKKHMLKIYTIGGVQKCADKFIDCSPFEIFSYFLNAEKVVTDTFHGSIFSIITQRCFVTIIRKSLGESYGNEEKLLDMLTRLNLCGRIAESVNEINDILKKGINYETVNKIIEKERNRSYGYLKKESMLYTQNYKVLADEK